MNGYVPHGLLISFGIGSYVGSGFVPSLKYVVTVSDVPSPQFHKKVKSSLPGSRATEVNAIGKPSSEVNGPNGSIVGSTFFTVTNIVSVSRSSSVVTFSTISDIS